MPRFEYKVVPAPEKSGKIKGVKGAARFAAALEEVMNALGQDGWRYLRTDTLPETERAGLTGTQTRYRNLLVFTREVPEIEREITPEPASEPTQPPAPPATPDPAPAAPPPVPATPEADPNLINLFDDRKDP